MNAPSNRLAGETSPYLLQHAHNPVEWYPWGAEALDKARSEDKPILLSIGYSACHWCHVMAHESFEDAATAALMNRHYVNVKVDREERPDLDKIYQTAHQLLTGRGGGWPLTLFLMPDGHTPFFAGTYFPPQPRYGMPSFSDVLEGVARFFRERRADLVAQNEQLRDALLRMQPAPAHAETLTGAPLREAVQYSRRGYDRAHGGFGAAPKFPHPAQLERLLRHWASSRGGATVEDHATRDMVLHTLRAMTQGGIYDHIGGGFYRYAVDARWMIPHFEKMLYDNGPLLALYADAWRITGDATFRRVAHETAAWAMREMQAPEGGFYSTLDADSEHEEGKFYVWTPEAVRALLDNPAQYELFARHYGLNQPANFESHWHLRVVEPAVDIARAPGTGVEEIERQLAAARARLLAARENRVRPGRDEKILAAWNGLMIKGMARAGRVFGRAEFVQSAARALDFIRAMLWRDGRLLATYKDGRARLHAYLDDHAFLIDAILELLQARWCDDELRFATELAEVMLAQFEDRAAGGFFFTAHDHEQLLQRPKPFSDDALPSGNGVAAQVLLRLGHLLNEPRYLDAAERVLRAGWAELREYPQACDALLIALEEWLTPGQYMIVRGAAAAIPPWIERCARDYAPHRLTFAVPSEATGLPLPQPAAAPEAVVAYVCTGVQCAPPVTSLAELDATLG